MSSWCIACDAFVTLPWSCEKLRPTCLECLKKLQGLNKLSKRGGIN